MISTEIIKSVFNGYNRIAFLGVGSELRNDDAVGGYVADKLNSLIISNKVTAINGGTAPENFTGQIKNFNPDLIVVIDAAYMNLKVGKINLIDAYDIKGISFSTHMLPLSITLNYLKSECNCDCIVFGIQPCNTEQGLDMNPVVKSKADLLCDMIIDSL